MLQDFRSRPPLSPLSFEDTAIFGTLLRSRIDSGEDPRGSRLFLSCFGFFRVPLPPLQLISPQVLLLFTFSPS